MFKKEEAEFTIGNSVQEDGADLFNKMHLKNLSREILNEIKEHEYIKSILEIKAIEFANKITNKLIDGCGLVSHDFPENNIHVLPLDLHREITKSGGAGRASHINQAIFLNSDKVRGKGNLRFGNIAFHEMLHMKSKTVFEEKKSVEENDVGVILSQRGLEIIPTPESNFEKGGQAYFGGGGLNEAIISHYEKFFVSEVLKSDLFKDEKEWLDSDEAKEIKKKIAQEKNIPEEEIYVANKNGTFDAYGYPKHEVVLEKIADKILDDNSAEFNSREEVIKEFFKAMITGNVSNITKLVENSFGPKSFLVLAIMKENTSSALEILEYFK